MAYRHTEDMGEISGFGGGYESCCQDMLEAGVQWITEHPDCDLKGHGFKGVTGIFVEDSPDAEALALVSTNAAKGEATGAMHEAVMRRLFFIRYNGWEKYCDEIRKYEREERDGSTQDNRAGRQGHGDGGAVLGEAAGAEGPGEAGQGSGHPDRQRQ